MALSFAGRLQNQGLLVEAESTGAPLLINRTRRFPAFLAPERSRKDTKRSSPKRERTAARRQTLPAMRMRFLSCSEGGFHSAGTTGSTRTMPATSDGKREANSGIVSPPKEWPTRRYGGGIPARSSRA